MSGATALLPFQPTEMSPAQLAAVSYLARYSGHTHRLYAFQLRRWFTWCEDHSALTSSSTSASSATRD
jgi:integrase/recombinase XerD